MNSSDEWQVAGVDGCPGGWMVTTLKKTGPRRELQCRVVPAFRYLLEEAPPYDLILVDMPIGLAPQGKRICDVQAKKLLGRRHASIFYTPVRASLNAPTYRQARTINLEAGVKGFSIQSFHIMPKIRELDSIMRGRPQLQGRIRETHPELCFRAFNRGVPLPQGKKSPVGRSLRYSLIRDYLHPHPGDMEKVIKGIKRKEASLDDIYDSMIAALAAQYVLQGQYVSLPEQGQVDAAGLKMEIVFPVVPVKEAACATENIARCTSGPGSG